MNNFYLIDKPISWTSFDVLRKMRGLIGIKKIGHTGTLDPLATGLLLVATGKYTKLIPYFEKDTKEYEFTIKLDGTTASFDKETEITKISEIDYKKFQKQLTKNKIQQILQQNFFGKIFQLPPKYSALKIGGQKALDLVRKGVDFELKKREVEISKIEILDFKYPELTLRATVSAGTYIRSIANDLGQIIGSGGYITELRRTKIGKLDIKLAQRLENLEKDNNLDINKLFSKENFIELDDKQLEKLNFGQLVKIENIDKNGLENEKKYMLKKDGNIINIVKLVGNFLKPIKKI